MPALEGVSLHSPGVRNARTFAPDPVISLHLIAQVRLRLPRLVGLGKDLGGEGRRVGVCQQAAAAAIAKPG